MGDSATPEDALLDFIQRSIRDGSKKSDNTPKWFVATLLHWRTYGLLLLTFAAFIIAHVEPPINANPASWGLIVGFVTYGLIDRVGWTTGGDNAE